MDYSLIDKYLNGATTEAEVRKIFNWIDDSNENRQSFICYKKAWALTASSQKAVGVAWNEVHNTIYGQRRKSISLLKRFSYAASVIVLVGVGMVLQYFLGNGNLKTPFSYHAQAEVVVPLGQMANVKLPDGTIVMLNSGSSLLYDGQFAGGTREVELKGEAFFDVAKDTEHLFMVKTAHVNMKVYGTTFNIKAYPEDKVVTTTLIEGSLGVSAKSKKEQLRLKPGESAVFDKKQAVLSVEKVDTKLYLSWRNGVVTFRNEKLGEIAKKIERWYNVKIVFKDKQLKEVPYWGTILKNKPVDQIFEVLKLTAGINYRIVPHNDKPNIVYWE